MIGLVQGRAPEALGIDIGGVVVTLADYQESDAVAGGHPLREIEDVRTALCRLRAERFGDNIFLVSKCGPHTEAMTRRALIDSGFCAETALDLDRVFFCRERADKAVICEALGVTHFVDDRLEVLSYLTNIENRYLFNPDPAEVEQFCPGLGEVRTVSNWKELVTLLLP